MSLKRSLTRKTKGLHRRIVRPKRELSISYAPERDLSELMEKAVFSSPVFCRFVGLRSLAFLMYTCKRMLQTVPRVVYGGHAMARLCIDGSLRLGQINWTVAGLLRAISWDKHRTLVLKTTPSIWPAEALILVKHRIPLGYSNRREVKIVDDAKSKKPRDFDDDSFVDEDMDPEFNLNLRLATPRRIRYTETPVVGITRSEMVNLARSYLVMMKVTMLSYLMDHLWQEIRVSTQLLCDAATFLTLADHDTIMLKTSVKPNACRRLWGHCRRHLPRSQ
jgi:hypothetical protein